MSMGLCLDALPTNININEIFVHSESTPHCRLGQENHWEMLWTTLRWITDRVIDKTEIVTEISSSTASVTCLRVLEEAFTTLRLSSETTYVFSTAAYGTLLSCIMVMTAREVTTA